MKLKVQHIMDAAPVLAAIINERRVMPQRGKYLIARLHSKLLSEFNVIFARRDEMIKEYGCPMMRVVPESVVEEGQPLPTEPVEGQWQVPADKIAEYSAAWKVIGDEEIEIDVQAIPLTAISLANGSNGEIEANELATLGELVYDNAN